MTTKLPDNFDIVASSDQIPYDWSKVVLQNLKERNKLQIEPLIAIYQSNTKLWYEHSRLQSLLKDVKHQFATVQHETAELLTSLGTDSSAGAVEKLKCKLAQIQVELREKGNLESNERKMKIDLSKKVRDQGKLIADQSEELKMAKSELSSSHEMTAFLREEIRVEKSSSLIVNSELNNVRSMFHKLEQENAELIERILSEKVKTAQAMNDMMNKQEGNIMNNRTSRHSEATSKVPTPSHQRNFSPGYLKILEAGPLLKINPVSNHQCHQSEINDICVTSSGDHFITAGSDASVRIFQMSSGRRVNSVESSSSTVCVDVSQCQDCSTDQWLTAGGSDGSCRVWNMLSGALRLRFTGHASKIQACKILGDGTSRLITASADRLIKVWDITRSQADTVSVLKTISSVCSVDIAPDMITLVSGHQDGAIRFWDFLRSPTCVHSVTQHTAHVTHVQFSPRNHYEILTSSKDNSLKIIDTRTYTASQVLKTSSLRITYDWSRTSFSPDGRYVSAGSTDGSICVWDLFTSKMVLRLNPFDGGHSSPVTSVNWSSPKGELLSVDKKGKCIIWT